MRLSILSFGFFIFFGIYDTHSMAKIIANIYPINANIISVYLLRWLLSIVR
ncbi:MAG: hypothetical protein HQK98_06485 [Nitrospirae bacterium]|nr:hypothetical protein [Nitrospirota bacterium]